MAHNPVLSALGRRLRLGVIGGGAGSFIGEVHRIAARLDDRYEVVAGVLSSNPDKAVAFGREIGLAADRAYANADQMFAAELARDDGIDVVAIMTPNDSHAPLSIASLTNGFDVICDKPLTNSLADAHAVAAAVAGSGRAMCVTYNYTGYPMVRQARAMVEAGELGDIRAVNVEYIQGHNATLVEGSEAGRDAWRFNAEIAGQSLVLGDIGTHAIHLATYVGRQPPARVLADVGALVPGRQVHDHAAVLMKLANDARGVFWVTNAAAGAEHGLHLRVYGAKGGLEWFQERPNDLHHMPIGEPARRYTRDGPGLHPIAARGTRVAIGHPEGYHEAFANLYADVAEDIVARRTGTAPDPLALWYPTVEDGVAGVAFIEACLRASAAGGWADVAA